MGFLLNFQPCVCKYFQENFNRLCAFKGSQQQLWCKGRTLSTDTEFDFCILLLLCNTDEEVKRKNIKEKNNAESFAKKKALLKLRVFYHLFVHSSLLSGGTPGFK